MLQRTIALPAITNPDATGDGARYIRVTMLLGVRRMTSEPATGDAKRQGRINPWAVIELAADLHILCRETAVLIDWIATSEARYTGLIALADTLDRKYAAFSTKPIGRAWNKVIGRRLTRRRLKTIWREAEIAPDRIRLLVRLLILNVYFIAGSIAHLYRQLGHLAREYNEYARAEGGELVAPPDNVPDLLELAKRTQKSLREARDSIAHPYRKKTSSRGSVERAATLVELLELYSVEINRQELISAFREFHKAARAADEWFAYGMSLRVTTSHFYVYLGWPRLVSPSTKSNDAGAAGKTEGESQQ